MYYSQFWDNFQNYKIPNSWNSQIIYIMSEDRASSYRVQFESADVRLKGGENRHSSDTNTTIGELDEETIRWSVLITRIVCCVLVCVIIASVALGETTHPEVLLLAALCGCVLVAVFMCSFVDVEAFRSHRMWRGKFFRESNFSSSSPINETHRRSDQI
jgi:hypothetical protein